MSKPTPCQFELFTPPQSTGKARTAPWRTLPVTTREALTTLMVRLLLDHAGGGGTGKQQGVTHHDD